MNKFLYLLLAIFAGFLASCADGNVVREAPEVQIKDKINVQNGEIIIDGTDSEGMKLPLLTSQKSSSEALKIAADGSQITTMYDGFGNKTEMRTFKNNPLVQSVIVRTFADGRRQIFVYGQNGEAKILPEDFPEDVLRASAINLANSAGIFIGRQPTTTEANPVSPRAIAEPDFPVARQPIENEKVQIAAAPEIKNEKPVAENLIDDKKFLMDLRNPELKTRRKITN